MKILNTVAFKRTDQLNLLLAGRMVGYWPVKVSLSCDNSFLGTVFKRKKDRVCYSGLYLF